MAHENKLSAVIYKMSGDVKALEQKAYTSKIAVTLSQTDQKWLNHAGFACDSEVSHHCHKL